MGGGGGGGAGARAYVCVFCRWVYPYAFPLLLYLLLRLILLLLLILSAARAGLCSRPLQVRLNPPQGGAKLFPPSLELPGGLGPRASATLTAALDLPPSATSTKCDVRTSLGLYPVHESQH